MKPVKGGYKKSINRSIKYAYLICGTIIRATREVNATCEDCAEPFKRAASTKKSKTKGG